MGLCFGMKCVILKFKKKLNINLINALQILKFKRYNQEGNIPQQSVEQVIQYVGSVDSVGCDSSNDKATGYGLDWSGIESLCGLDFPHLSRTTLGLTQLPVEWVPGLCRW